MLALLLSLLQPASAHGLDGHRLTLEVEGDVVRATATPGTESFRAADLDRDGELDRAEVGAARGAIRSAFSGAFRLADLAGREAVCDPASVSTVGEGAAHVRISQRCVFPSRPEALVVALGLPAAAPVAVEAVRVWRVSPTRWVPEGLVERAALSPAGSVVVLMEPECGR